MKHLWAPWRINYILGPKPDTCIFCLPTQTDEDKDRLILYRAKHSFIIMNKFPYSNGHIMICPYRHLMDISLLTDEESNEIMQLMKKSSTILNQYFKCEGLNIGLNQGQAAGAGIREHIHFHIVPRWNGDSSFMAVFNDIRTMPSSLEHTYSELLPLFHDIDM